MDHHQFKEKEEKMSQQDTVCSQIVLKCIYFAGIGRPGILWSVDKLARAVIKRTKSCDKRLARLISYIHHTCEYRQYCHVGNTAKRCRSGLFQDSDFARDLEDSKSTSGGVLCIFGSHNVRTNKLDVEETDFCFTTVLQKLTWSFCYLLFPHQTGWSPERLSTHITLFYVKCSRAALSYFSFRSLCSTDLLSVEQ